MNKIIITVLSAILMICLLPMSASAEELLKAPTVQYKLINHDEIALRRTEVDDADGWCESDFGMLYYDKNGKINYKELYSEKRAVLSGPVGDDKYIYFLSEPLYNITDKTDTVIYRANYDGSGLQKIITIPKDNSFVYGIPNNSSVKLFHCDGDYLYYYVCGKKASEISRRRYYTFYRININEKDAVPQEITSVDDLSLPYNRSVKLCNGYLYIKTYTYDKNYNEVPIYICIGANEKGLKNQDKPFEWRH